MKSYHQKFISDHPLESTPMAEIAGFPVRPGIFDLNGSSPLQNGVNFTIHTCGGTSCELLLFHRAQEEPFAVLPFPEAYKIGDVLFHDRHTDLISKNSSMPTAWTVLTVQKRDSFLIRTTSFWILTPEPLPVSEPGESAGITPTMHEL